jgi:hypothetical protein
MAGNSFAVVIGRRRERLKIRTNRVKVSLAGHKGGGDKVHNSHAEEGARCGGNQTGSSDP